ncbi:MAG: LysR family transcriptional regulator [Pseudomonadota bacterium]
MNTKRVQQSAVFQPDSSDWSDIALFLAVLDAGNLVAAGTALGLSQPTVGRRLAGLEKRMGVTLFARSGRRLIPTDIARRIEESARRMAREMNAIERGIASEATGLRGQVTISANEGTGSEWLVPVLVELQKEHPEIYIDLKIESRAADLVQREADIALRMGRPTQPDLIARKLADVGFGIYAARSFLKGQRPIREITDLNDTPWVLGTFTKRGDGMLNSFFDEHALDCRIALGTNSPAAQLRAVQQGMGFGVLSHRWAGKESGLVRVLPDITSATISLWLVTHEDLRHSARLRAVADHIAAAAREDAELFARGREGETPASA